MAWEGKIRVSREQAEKNRERVIEAAARLFRKYGFDGVGIDAVMAEAGLTHGGFYKSFSSKEELIAEACRRVAGRANEARREQEEAGADPLATLVAQYLSMEHCREPGSACLFATLAGDAARRDTAVRSTFTEGLQAFVDHIAALLPHASDARRHEAALAVAATMIGAVTIARASNDEAFAEEMLKAARASILALEADTDA